MTEDTSAYRVVFVQDDSIVELYAKRVYELEHMYGFVAIEGFIFGERSSVVVDPQEERLKALLADVEATYIPVQEIVRIDRVKKQGVSKISPRPQGGSISHFPSIVPSKPKGNV